MATADKIRDEKLKYGINREKQRYQHYHKVKLINMIYTGGKIMPPDQSKMIEQTKFTYFF